MIKVKVPKNEQEFANLFAAIIDAFREAGEDLPEYFDEPNIADDLEFEDIFTQILQEYYQSNTENQRSDKKEKYV